MARLSAKERAELPDSAFAYIDSRGNRRLPINDEAHVRNALARFNQVRFESDEAREKALEKLIKASIAYGIAPIGFVASQLRQARSKARPDLPHGQVTLMIADIEDSTRLAHRKADEYPLLLEELRDLIREETTSHGGYEVDARGDESFCVFAEAAKAVGAAISIQRRLQAPPWNGSPRVRIGLHSGVPARTDTGYEGLPVHTAARVCSAAHGGQILMSASTRDEMESGSDRFTTVSLGSHPLRGLPEPVELFQVTEPGLPDRFPSLRTGNAV